MLCAIQKLVKRREAEQQNKLQNDDKKGTTTQTGLNLSDEVFFFLLAMLIFIFMLSKASDAAKEEAEKDEEPVEDLLKPGHLTRLLEEELAAEVEALCVGDVSGGVERLLSCLRTQRDSCLPQQLQVAAHGQQVNDLLSDVMRVALLRTWDSKPQHSFLNV